ncbi:LLM class flavin-dependent oxidoreductase [Priestia koreensis]|uniref:LLM class flavin-dependent oxidoreductase n=1 Tax=Priestia koreensis TaxID=284581 RepID=UPI003D07ACD7
MIRLGVLDQTPISNGQTPSDAFGQSVELAQWAERLGYERYWLAEHHNTSGLAGTSPTLLMTHIASKTDNIKVGSGGVLLPQYSPFKVAEDFHVMETLFPGRVELGIGRSPGGGNTTRLALTDGIRRSMNEFPRQVADLQYHLHNRLPSDHEFAGVIANPKTEQQPEIWLLGINQRSARLAAEQGTAFTFGHFINPTAGEEAIDYYYEHFQPSFAQHEPHVNVCVFVVCAPTDEEAEYHAKSLDLWLLKVENGLDTRVPSPEEAKNRVYNERDREKIAKNRRRMIVGNPEKAVEELEELKKRYQTDEFLIITNIYDFEAKKRSYQLLAEAIKSGSHTHFTP